MDSTKTTRKWCPILPDVSGFSRSEKKRYSKNSIGSFVPQTPAKKTPLETNVKSTRIMSDILNQFPCENKWEKISDTKSSKIFKVQDRSGRNYVLKHINPKFLKTKKDQEESMLEFENAKLIGSHPNLVTYHEYWWFGSHLWFQIDFCELGSLKKFLSTNSLRGETQEKDLMWKFFLDILLGLSHIHKKGFVHLDIKPDNIFLVSGDNGVPRLKIGDFGLLRHAGSRYFDEGDGNYLPPELLPCSEEKIKIDGRTDIFSLGVTIYEMSTDIEVNGFVWEQIKLGVFDLSGVSIELSDLIRKMAHVDVTQRPTALQIISESDKLQMKMNEFGISLETEEETSGSVESTPEIISSKESYDSDDEAEESPRWELAEIKRKLF